MKLLYLNHNVVRTGTYVRAANFAREVVAAGHEVTLVTTSPDLRAAGREREWEGVRIIESPDLLTGSARTGWDAWNTTWRVRRLADEQFDVIHAFDSRPAVILPALAVRRRTDAPLFIDWADWWGRGGTIEERSGWAVRTFFGPIETWFEEAFRVHATANTTIVESLSERCVALGVDPRRVKWLPNGCTAPEPEPVDRMLARSQLQVGDEPLLLYLGVAFPADAAFLFEAFRHVRTQLPAARLVMVGRNDAAVPPDLADAVTRTGFVEDAALKLWLAAADAGLLVMRDTVASRGRWPGKLSDYLSGGVPIVTTEVGAAAAYLRSRGAAAVAPPTPAGFARRIVEVLGDGAVREQIALSGRRLAATELGWPAVTQALLAFYDEWVGAGSGAATDAEGRIAVRLDG
jgi:glycosyltransferase involved in cell wall biosynthesis